MAVWASDLARARQTAEILVDGTDLKVRLDPRLREFDVGERQGMTLQEASQRWPTIGSSWTLGSPPEGLPGSESYAEVALRIVPAVEEALGSLECGQCAVLVVHGASVKVALAGLLGWERSHLDSLTALDNCHQAVVEQSLDASRRIRLRGYNVPARTG